MRGLCFCRTPRGEKEGKRNSACHDIDRQAELDRASGGLGVWPKQTRILGGVSEC